MGPTRSKIGEKGPKWGLFWVLPFIKIPLISPSLDQKEQNCFGHPQIYSLIAPMLLSIACIRYVVGLLIPLIVVSPISNDDLCMIDPNFQIALNSSVP